MRYPDDLPPDVQEENVAHTHSKDGKIQTPIGLATDQDAANSWCLNTQDFCFSRTPRHRLTHELRVPDDSKSATDPQKSVGGSVSSITIAIG